MALEVISEHENSPGVVAYLLTPLVLCAPILLAETHMYAGTLTNCSEAMTWPNHLKTACSGSAVHYIPPPAFGYGFSILKVLIRKA